MDELTRDRSAMSLEAANREVYLLLKEGLNVSVPDSRYALTPGCRTLLRFTGRLSEKPAWRF